MPITFGMKESSYLCSQITGGVENVVSLHANIPRTDGRDFDLTSEDALQEYFKFQFFFCSRVIAVNFVLQITTEEKVLGVCSSLAPISSNFSSVSTRPLSFVFLSIKNPVALSLFTKL
jgi:hypothetical protein